ncbi:MAG: hypothetical protein LBV74_04505 [Tannerella sp.]|jgi:hypothetical protein|nr:hypothetical protein [Tannerella sp.]
MKNVCAGLAVFIAVVNIILFTGCKDDDEKKVEVLSVTPTTLTFTADETQTKTVEVTTNADFWFVEKSDDWVRHSKSGNKLFISVLNHMSTVDGRTATVTVMTGEAQPVDITVTQNAREANAFSINPTSLSYDANEIGDRTVTITTDAESWDATTDATWIKLLKQDNTLKVSIFEENTKSTPLTGDIKITAGNAPGITLTVTQAAVMFLSAEPATLLFKADETGEKPVGISTNAISWNATTDASWIKLIKQNDVLKVIVNEKNTLFSSRDAKVKITADKAPDFILPVTQAAAIYLSVDPESLSFKANDKEKLITISTNAESWDATTDETSWVTLTKQNDVLRVTTGKNDSGLAREAKISIIADRNAVVTIPITQAK